MTRRLVDVLLAMPLAFALGLILGVVLGGSQVVLR